MNPLDRMANHMNYNDLDEWKAKATKLTSDIDGLINPYNGILDTYAAARNAAADAENREEEENVDTIFRELTDAKNRLCALMGGRRRSSRRRSKVAKRSRKYRR
jgi:hypothetical protein